MAYSAVLLVGAARKGVASAQRSGLTSQERSFWGVQTFGAKREKGTLLVEAVYWAKKRKRRREGKERFDFRLVVMR